MNNSLLNMALQLSVQDMFSSAWFSNALMNKVWTEAMRSSVHGLIRKTGGADLLGAALGGQPMEGGGLYKANSPPPVPARRAISWRSNSMRTPWWIKTPLALTR